MLQCANIIRIKMHGLQITGILVLHLLTKTLRLVFGIIQFGKAIGYFAAADEELEAVGDKRVCVSLRRASGDTSVG